MKENIFRQYDIRGKVGSELDLNQVYDLGLAIAVYFKENKKDIKTVAIGMDGRSHSKDIKESLTKAMQDSGLDVVFVGMCPTPVLYFCMFNEVGGKKPEAGLMITASHNPKEYNGIKMCLGKNSIWGQQVQVIKDMFFEKKRLLAAEVIQGQNVEQESKCEKRGIGFWSCCCSCSKKECSLYEKRGEYSEADAMTIYLNWLKKEFKHLIGCEISAVLDSGNGVGGVLVPRLVKEFGWKNVKTIFDEVDGNYPNHEADPIVEENMRFVKQILQESDIQVGVGFDGDCDRMGSMTKAGVLVTGDKMLSIFARPILAQEKYKGAVVVCDIKASSGLQESVEKMGGKVELAPSGVSNIKKIMQKNDSPLGGELSCHFFFADKYFGYDDAFYAMLRLFEILQNSGKTLDQLVAEFPVKISTHEIRMACPDDKKEYIVEKVKSFFSKVNDAKIVTTDGVKVIKSYGWGILRASNTQPVLSLRFESSTIEGLDKIRNDFIDVLKDDFDKDLLKREFFA